MSVHALLHEREADHAAAHATKAGGGCGCKCAACAKKAAGQPRPIEPAVRAPFERAFGTNLDTVRVREDSTATRLGASAFAQGDDIAFAPGRYQPDTAEGQHLLGHEIAHTLQQRPNPAWGLTAAPHGAIQRNGDTPAVNQAAVFAAVNAISHAVETDDVGTAVPLLRERTLEERKLIRTGVHDRTHQWLEHWFVDKMNEASTQDTATGVIAGTLLLPLGGVLIAGGGAAAVTRADPGDPVRNGTAEEGVRRMWRAAPLIDRLEVYDEGFREIEQAQLDVIRSSSDEERAEAVATAEIKARLDAVLSHMSGREEYECRKLVYTSDQDKWDTAKRMLKVGDEDPLFDAILDLAPQRRRDFRDEHRAALESEIGPSDFRILNAMVDGDEVDALLARLDRATEWRMDDAEGIGSVIDRAVALLRQRAQLQLDINSRSLEPEPRRAAQARVLALDRLAERMLAFTRLEGGELDTGSFLARIAAARGDAGAFAADAQRLAEFVPPTQAEEFAFEIAKQRILLAGADLTEIRNAVVGLHASRTAPDGTIRSEAARQTADAALRQRLLDDTAVHDIVIRLGGVEEMLVEQSVNWDRFREVQQDLGDAFDSARWGDFFHHTLVIARNDEWRRRFRQTATEAGSYYSRVHDPERTLMERILESQGMPLVDLLAYTGNVETLRAAFDDIREEDRTALRLGWYLRTQTPVGPAPSAREAAAMELYDTFAARLHTSQTTLWLFHDEHGEQTVLGATLGAEPTREELSSPEGRYRAALFWHTQIESRLRLDRGVSAHFTESDETMVAAAREFEALWTEVEGRGALTMIDFSALAALQQQVETRSTEFEEASNAIGEMAGMVAATVAGIAIVAATGGAATPAVIAAAAAAGGTARVVTREMFGAQYYNALSDAGARDLLLGGIDAALAVIGGQLAARGVEMLGLGGRALTSGASRIAGEVAEHATQPLARRVLASSVESAIDGVFSGAVSEAFGALADDRTWRRGIMNGLARVGQAALIGGLAGLGGGALIGGVLPVLGTGGRWLVGAVTGRTLENTLQHAGASGLLAEARAAARAGRVEEANALAAQLERHLSADEALALRREIGDELRTVLRDPPGRGPVSDAERALLDETRTLDTPAGPHLDNELGVVRRSQPQPSREPGFIDEVDLGNGHTWRRAEDGTWCRFTRRTLCHTAIPGAPSPAAIAREARLAGDRARAAAARAVVESAQLTEANQRMLQSELWEIYEKVRVAPIGRPARIDTSLLNDEERNLLRSLFDTDEPAFPLLRDAADPEKADELLSRLHGLADSASRRAVTAQQPFAARLRNAIRSRVDDIRTAAGGIDRLSLRPPPSGALEVEHIVPFSEIMDMPGFMSLSWQDQVALEMFDDNLKAIDSVVNNLRGTQSWTNPTWLPPNHGYSTPQLAHMASEEIRLRRLIQDEIARRGGRVGP